MKCRRIAVLCAIVFALVAVVGCEGLFADVDRIDPPDQLDDNGDNGDDECAGPEDCDDGEICDDGECVIDDDDDSCDSVADCEDGEVCDPDSGRCVSPECEDHGGCGDQGVCVGGLCHVIACDSPDECVEEIEVLSDGSDEGGPYDCQGAECVPAVGCGGGGDCHEGELCIDGICHDQCDGSIDCPQLDRFCVEGQTETETGDLQYVNYCDTVECAPGEDSIDEHAHCVDEVTLATQKDQKDWYDRDVWLRCHDQTCALAECSSDGDCPELWECDGELCEPETVWCGEDDDRCEDLGEWGCNDDKQVCGPQ